MIIKKYPTYVGLALTLISLYVSIVKGSIHVPLYQLFFEHHGHFGSIFLTIRAERAINAFIAGGLLALAGTIMQLLLRNPLADPYILGTSSGAALFMLIMMLFGISTSWYVAGAWAGSFLSIMLLFLMARKHQWQTHSLLLFGIALACFYAAGISLLLMISPAAKLHSMLFWLSGDLSHTHFSWPPTIILIVGVLLSAIVAPGMNILARGDQEARALGLSVNYFRCLLYLLSSLFTAAAVTLAGCIGFVGLLVPHLMRRLLGNDHRTLFTASMLAGGSIVMLADTVSRTAFTPIQLPVGIILALIGAPIFIWILK